MREATPKAPTRDVFNLDLDQQMYEINMNQASPKTIETGHHPVARGPGTEYSDNLVRWARTDFVVYNTTRASLIRIQHVDTRTVNLTACLTIK